MHNGAFWVTLNILDHVKEKVCNYALEFINNKMLPCYINKGEGLTNMLVLCTYGQSHDLGSVCHHAGY